MRAEKKSESKVLERAYYEMKLEGAAGKLTRKEAVEALSKELGVATENLGLISLDGHSGTTNVVGRFYVYGSPESKRRAHPRYLDERMLTNEEREKLRQERKKAATPAPSTEAKK